MYFDRCVNTILAGKGVKIFYACDFLIFNAFQREFSFMEKIFVYAKLQSLQLIKKGVFLNK